MLHTCLVKINTAEHRSFACYTKTRKAPSKFPITHSHGSARVF